MKKVMREIKFRALSMCKGERWVYGDIRHYARNPHTEKWTIYDGITGFETDIEENTIGQYVGIKDMNGKEIYEGDKVVCQYGRKPFGIVTWQPKGYFFIDTTFGSVEAEHHSCLAIGEFMEQQINGEKIKLEVVGNKYENREFRQRKGVR